MFRPKNPNAITTGIPDSTVHFHVLEVIRGDARTDFTLPGYLSDKDDFNDRPSPYNFVRSPQPVTGRPLHWVLWANRLFAMAALGLVAGLLHFRIRDFRLLENMNQELHTALDEIKTLRGILLICSYCKKIEANPETWVDLENYVRRHSDAEFNHGVCPDCLRKVTQKTSRG